MISQKVLHSVYRTRFFQFHSVCGEKMEVTYATTKKTKRREKSIRQTGVVSLPGSASFTDRTRPDTRPIPVADAWAGAEMRVFPLFDSITTDQPTDRRTDKASYRVASPRLKRERK